MTNQPREPPSGGWAWLREVELLAKGFDHEGGQLIYDVVRKVCLLLVAITKGLYPKCGTDSQSVRRKWGQSGIVSYCDQVVGTE